MIPCNESSSLNHPVHLSNFVKILNCDIAFISRSWATSEPISTFVAQSGRVVCDFGAVPQTQGHLPSGSRVQMAVFLGHQTGSWRRGPWLGSKEWQPQTSPIHMLVLLCSGRWLSTPTEWAPAPRGNEKEEREESGEAETQTEKDRDEGAKSKKNKKTSTCHCQINCV